MYSKVPSVSHDKRTPLAGGGRAALLWMFPEFPVARDATGAKGSGFRVCSRDSLSEHGKMDVVAFFAVDR